MGDGAAERLVALDLIRGVAVLGILAVNIAGFAGPHSAVYTPAALPGLTPAGDGWHAIMLVVFEGKMRALFTLLFGAGLLLFVNRADARGKPGVALQLKRLGWLALFGYLHYLLWWGDILFIYAIAGTMALVLHEMPRRAMLSAALVAFAAWQVHGSVRHLPAALDEIAVIEGTASAEQLQRFNQAADRREASDAREVESSHRGFVWQARDKLGNDPGYPLRVAWGSLGETLPLMLIGMVLLRDGFFSGGWSRRAMGWTAAGGIISGGAATIAFTGWAWRLGWPHEVVAMAMNGYLGFPHLAMAIGFAALLVLAAPAVGWLGQRLVAAGRMAFTNYIATSVVMTAIFQGWGLGLFATMPAASLPAFVLLGWLLMLGWSAPWLARFGQGPLERLWRTLVNGRRDGCRQ